MQQALAQEFIYRVICYRPHVEAMRELWESRVSEAKKNGLKCKRVARKQWKRLEVNDEEEDDVTWLEPVEAEEAAVEDVANLNLNFQVAAVRKPLLSVKRISDLGNRVVFGREANYIENEKTGKRLILHPKGRGSYVLKVRFVDGSEEDVVVDSGNGYMVRRRLVGGYNFEVQGVATLTIMVNVRWRLRPLFSGRTKG